VTRPTYPEYLSDRFARDIAERQLTILHDDGLYRHLRCQKPGSSIYLFEVVTWPGALAITGDFDGFTFRRTNDMFTFFRWEDAAHGRINPDYWSEKVAGGRKRCWDYSERMVREYITEVIREYGEDDPDGVEDLRKKVDEEILDDSSWDSPDLSDESAARAALDGFAHEGVNPFGGAWEHRFRDWNHRFLWACHAIVWAIQRYDAKAFAPPAPKVEDADVLVGAS
jgi:hypothetical protein